MAKTISAYADSETATRVTRLAQLEQRPVSQLATAALAFYVRLSEQAHAALRHVEALGSPDDYERVLRRVTGVLLDAQFELAQRAIVAAMPTAGPSEQAEDALLTEAMRVTGARPTGDAATTKPPRRPGRTRR